MSQHGSSNDLIKEFLGIFLTILLLIWYLHYKHCFSYWQNKGVPTCPPLFPAGNITHSLLGKKNLFVAVQDFYNEFKSKGHKHGGLYFFNGPVYLPVDPKIIKSIMITDFEHFVDRGMFLNEEKFPLSAHIFSDIGLKWKNVRSGITPSFSSGKLKVMYEVIKKHTEKFIAILEQQLADKNGEINLKATTINFAVDNISAAILGYEGGTLSNPTNELAATITKMSNPSFWLFLKTLIIEGFHKPGNILRVGETDEDVEKFFIALVGETIKMRKHNSLTPKDYLSFILKMRDEEKISFNAVVGNFFLMYLAGFETVSQAISYCIHELAHNQVVQDKLRAEVFDNLGKDFKNFDYEDLCKLSYLDKVLKEMWRKYPTLGFLNRVCVKRYKVPGTDVVIEEGTPVLISALGLQRDPEYWPDPLRFVPERFNDTSSHVPCTFMPFGEGPRFCIGMRFGKLQAKMAVTALISQFKFMPSPRSLRHIELDPLSKSLTMLPTDGITVKISKL